MNLTLISIFSCALIVAALPQDTEKQLREKCSNNQLSCCSNLKSTAEANGNTVSLEGVNPINVLGELTNTVSQVTDIIPISILSGCAPILGDSQITCVNYIACCVPHDDRDDHEEQGDKKDYDENKCHVLKDTRVTRKPGLLSSLTGIGG